MNCMFKDCSSLTNINLSNINSNNFINTYEMFSGCKKLIKDNIIVYDKKILEQLKNL